MSITVGCSGWSYSDWQFLYGTHSDRLKIYSATFGAVEINTSFYRIPAREAVLRWLKKTEYRPGFLFSFKVPQDISHRLNTLGQNEMYTIADTFTGNCLEPSMKEGRLLGVLLQLPPWAGEEWLDNLERLCNYFLSASVEIFIETRSSTNFNEQIRSSLQKIGINIVDTDGPFQKLGNIIPGGEKKYIRMHGRNSAAWLERSSGMERYRYNYNDEEIAEIGNIIRDASHAFREIFVFFNNHPGGNAPRNAMKLMEILGISRGLDGQKTLF